MRSLKVFSVKCAVYKIVNLKKNAKSKCLDEVLIISSNYKKIVLQSVQSEEKESNKREYIHHVKSVCQSNNDDSGDERMTRIYF